MRFGPAVLACRFGFDRAVAMRVLEPHPPTIPDTSTVSLLRLSLGFHRFGEATVDFAWQSSVW